LGACTDNVEKLGKAIIDSHGFYDKSTNAVCMVWLLGKAFADFADSVDKASEKLSIGGTAAKKAKRRKCNFTERLIQIQTDVWQHVKQNFEQMYGRLMTEIVCDCCRALRHEGLVELDDGEQIIDLVEFEKDARCFLAFECGLLKTGIAKDLKVLERMEELTQTGVDILMAMKLTLLQDCPKVAALYGGDASEEVAEPEIKRYATFDAGKLQGVGVDEDFSQMFVEQIVPRLNAIQETRGAVVFTHAKSLMDSCLVGDIGGLREDSIKKLCKRCHPCHWGLGVEADREIVSFRPCMGPWAHGPMGP